MPKNETRKPYVNEHGTIVELTDAEAERFAAAESKYRPLKDGDDIPVQAVEEAMFGAQGRATVAAADAAVDFDRLVELRAARQRGRRG